MIDTYWLPFFVTVVCLGIISIYKKYKPRTSIVLIYFLVHSGYIVFTPNLLIESYEFTLHVKYFAACFLISLLVLTHINISLCLPRVFKLLAAISVFAPVLGNPSLTGCFLVFLMALDKFSWWYVAPLLVHPTSLGLLSLLVYLSPWGLLGLVFLPVGRYLDFFSDNGRFNAYQKVLEYFPYDKILLGHGAGSFIAYGPNLIQGSNVQDATLDFIYLHSDLLQLAFEFGLVGLALVLFIAAPKLVSRKYYVLAPALLFNYPFHNAIFSMLVLSVFLKEEQKSAYPRFY